MGPTNEAADPGEEDVLQAIRRGDTARIGELLESHRPRLERMVAFRLDARLRGRVDPQDVVQETFAEVLAHLSAFETKEGMSFFLWLRLETGKRLNAVHRRHLEARARDARLEVPLAIRGIPGASSFAIASAILDGGSTPSRAAIRQEQAQLLQDAIEGMKEMDREILSLRNFEQLTNKEVAQLLELTEPAATLRYVRALRRLEGILSEVGIASEGSA